MDNLIAKANTIGPLTKRRRTSGSNARKPKLSVPSNDATFNSIAQRTALPKSLRSSSPLPENVTKYKHIANKRLRSELTRHSEHAARSKALLEDTELLLIDEAGKVEVEGEMERTWRVSQDEIVEGAGQEAAKGRRELKLDGGPYCSRFSRNGRHLAIAGKTGHVATFDWRTGTLHAELQLKETCRDITFLHDHSFFAVAQKKYTFVYDRDGVEVHRLKAHVEPTRLEFLPYHWLLASVGNAGYLKYQDTSTGQLLVEHRTKLGVCKTMTQNPHNAVIHLGHQNGTVTLWTPNLPHPVVRLLAHLGPVVSVGINPSQGGRYMATAGQDRVVKVWDCRNWKGAVREWTCRSGVAHVEWSQRGSLGVGGGGTVNVYTSPAVCNPHPKKLPPPLYLTHPVLHRPITSLRFAPFQDVLAIGHAAGLSSILVPGSGEPNFDSTEADPFESKKARREREVKALLDKVKPDMIMLDPEFVGSLAPQTEVVDVGPDGRTSVPFARLSRYSRLKVSGKADETEDVGDSEAKDENGNIEREHEDDPGDVKKKTKEEREKRKMRGKGKSLKRYLRRQRKNVIDPKVAAIRAKLEKQREEKRKEGLAASVQEVKKPSALDRFKREC